MSKEELLTQAKEFLADYDSRKLTGKYSEWEPSWDLVPYTSLRRFVSGDNAMDKSEFATEEEYLSDIQDTIEGLSGPQISAYRHDGFTPLSPSWIFMGRAEPSCAKIAMGDDVYALGRKISKELYAEMLESGLFDKLESDCWWIAYSTRVRLHYRCIGPCANLFDLEKYMSMEFPKGYSGVCDF